MKRRIIKKLMKDYIGESYESVVKQAGRDGRNFDVYVRDVKGSALGNCSACE